MISESKAKSKSWRVRTCAHTHTHARTEKNQLGHQTIVEGVDTVWNARDRMQASCMQGILSLAHHVCINNSPQVPTSWTSPLKTSLAIKQELRN